MDTVVIDTVTDTGTMDFTGRMTTLASPMVVATALAGSITLSQPASTLYRETPPIHFVANGEAMAAGYPMVGLEAGDHVLTYDEAVRLGRESQMSLIDEVDVDLGDNL